MGAGCAFVPSGIVSPVPRGAAGRGTLDLRDRAEVEVRALALAIFLSEPEGGT